MSNFVNNSEGKGGLRAKPEIKVCGINACTTLVEARAQDVIRVYVTEERIKTFGSLLRWCAANKKAYHVVSVADLEKVAETQHHEGVCILAKRRAMLSFPDLLKREREATGTRCVVFLENIQNPHNLGAIVRVCAHFGAVTVLTASTQEPDAVGSGAALSPAVYRTAEGGLEGLDLIQVQEPLRALRALRTAGFQLYATSSHANHSLYETAFHSKSVLMFGSESEGLTEALFQEADEVLAIPGTGHVESLNVACAASVVLAEMMRPRTEKQRTPISRRP